jgi:hypothetical protein
MAHFEFCNQDITLDVLMKIEQVVRILAINNNIPFDNMLGKFYSSKTYKNLNNIQSGLWAESAEFIADDYELVG